MTDTHNIFTVLWFLHVSMCQRINLTIIYWVSLIAVIPLPVLSVFYPHVKRIPIQALLQQSCNKPLSPAISKTAHIQDDHKPQNGLLQLGII